MILKVLSLLGVALCVLGKPHVPAVSEQYIIRHDVPIQRGHHGELGHIGAELKHHEEYAWSYPSYEFAYMVNDPHTGDHKGHAEHRLGDIVKGEYWLYEPDGNKRTVQYHADKSGFHAQVHNSNGRIHHIPKSEPQPEIPEPERERRPEGNRERRPEEVHERRPEEIRERRPEGNRERRPEEMRERRPEGNRERRPEPMRKPERRPAQQNKPIEIELPAWMIVGRESERERGSGRMGEQQREERREDRGRQREEQERERGMEREERGREREEMRRREQGEERRRGEERGRGQEQRRGEERSRGEVRTRAEQRPRGEEREQAEERGRGEQREQRGRGEEQGRGQQRRKGEENERGEQRVRGGRVQGEERGQGEEQEGGEERGRDEQRREPERERKPISVIEKHIIHHPLPKPIRVEEPGWYGPRIRHYRDALKQHKLEKTNEV